MYVGSGRTLASVATGRRRRSAPAAAAGAKDDRATASDAHRADHVPARRGAADRGRVWPRADGVAHDGYMEDGRHEHELDEALKFEKRLCSATKTILLVH